MLCCYFPTTVLMLDDSEAFLYNFSRRLDKRSVYLLETNPIRALERIENTYTPFDSVEGLRNTTKEADQQAHDFCDVSHLANNPKRFEAISVVIVDYSMPEMNGLEVLKKLSGLPLKKIMLTGEASLETAVTGFNDGLIDKFFLKNSPSLYQDINQAIIELQSAYFESLTEKIVGSMPSDEAKFLKDSTYAELFKKTHKETKTTEYYLTCPPGNYLMIDAQGKRSWLVVNSDEDIKTNCDVATENDAPDDVMEQLKYGSKILFDTTWENFLTSSFDWKKVMHPAIAIGEGASRYYYATIN